MLLEVYFLVRKRTYIDILEPTGKDGKTNNSEHIRMKGIPAPCIKYYAQQKGRTVLDVFEKFFKNKAIKVDLTNDNTKSVCMNNKDYTISNASLENANTSGMKVVSSLLNELSVFG